MAIPTKEQITKAIMEEYRDDLNFLEEVNVRTFGLINILKKTKQNRIENILYDVDNE